MTDDKKRLIDRIAKLFALGDATKNQSEHEVMAAATKARQLMAEHNLTMADLSMLGDSATAEAVRIHIERQTAYTRKTSRFAYYDDLVAHAVDAICGTRNMLRWWYEGSSKVLSRQFVGTEHDVAVAVNLFHVLLVMARRMARNRCGAGWSTSHESYAEGLTWRIYERAHAATLSNLSPTQSTALVKYEERKADAISRWLDEEGVRPSAKQRSFRGRDPIAFAAGQRDGNTVDFRADKHLK